MDLFKNLRIKLRRRLGLARGLGGAERFQQRVVVQILAAMSVGPGAQLGQDAAFPIDERAIAIEGIFKRPVDDAVSTGTARRDTFSTRVPDVGDPTLIPELRKQQVVIDVSVPSAWTWLLGRIPFPILIFLGAMLVGGLVRLVRRGTARSGSAMPMHGMMGLISGLFGRQQAAGPPGREDDESTAR